MNVLVINAGSSSLKFQLLDVDTREVYAKGNCERIGIEGSFVGYESIAVRASKRSRPTFPTTRRP
jgi:acetate kinase